jgi:hypothetical protein
MAAIESVVIAELNAMDMSYRVMHLRPADLTIELVLQPATGAELNTLAFGTRKYHMQQQAEEIVG